MMGQFSNHSWHLHQFCWGGAIPFFHSSMSQWVESVWSLACEENMSEAAIQEKKKMKGCWLSQCDRKDDWLETLGEADGIQRAQSTGEQTEPLAFSPIQPSPEGGEKAGRGLGGKFSQYPLESLPPVSQHDNFPAVFAFNWFTVCSNFSPESPLSACSKPPTQRYQPSSQGGL